MTDPVRTAPDDRSRRSPLARVCGWSSSCERVLMGELGRRRWQAHRCRMPRFAPTAHAEHYRVFLPELYPIRIGPEPGIIGDRLQPGDTAELPPQIVVRTADHDRSIGRLERLIGTERLVARSAFLRLHAALPIGLQIVAEQPHRRVEQRDLNRAALSGLFACEKDRHDAAERMHAGHLVDRRNLTANEAPTLIAGYLI